MQVWLAAVMIGATGCSLMITPAPAAPQPGAPVECTSSSAAPVLDFLLGGVSAVIAASALANAGGDCADDGDTTNCEFGKSLAPIAAVTGAVVGAVFIASGIRGMRHTGRCRRLKAQRAPPQ